MESKLSPICCRLQPALSLEAAGQEDRLPLDGPDDQAVEDDQDGEGDDVDYHRDGGGDLENGKYVTIDFTFTFSRKLYGHPILDTTISVRSDFVRHAHGTPPGF